MIEAMQQKQCQKKNMTEAKRKRIKSNSTETVQKKAGQKQCKKNNMMETMHPSPCATTPGPIQKSPLRFFRANNSEQILPIKETIA